MAAENGNGNGKIWGVVVKIAPWIFTAGVVWAQFHGQGVKIDKLEVKYEDHDDRIAEQEKNVAVSNEQYREILRRLDTIDRKLGNR